MDPPAERGMISWQSLGVMVQPLILASHIILILSMSLVNWRRSLFRIMRFLDTGFIFDRLNIPPRTSLPLAMSRLFQNRLLKE